jgi:VanZ family protein
MPAKREKPLPMLCGAAVIGCFLTLAILAWLPAKAMTRTSLGGHAEHLIAYLATAIVMGIAFRNRLSPGLQGVLLIAYAAILEVGQIYSPGRTASLHDFLFSATGAVLGVLLLWTVRTVATMPRATGR